MARSTPHGLIPRMMAAMALLALVYAIPIGAALWAGIPWPGVAAVVVLVVTVQWFGTEYMARKIARAHVVGPEEQPHLHAALDRLCALNDLPKPRVAISRDRVPNAFTVGRSRKHTTIVVTTGLLDKLETDELTAAMAHEVAHIRHRDVAVMTLASSLAIFMAWSARGVAKVAGNAPGAVLEAPLFALALLAGAAAAGLLSALAYLPLRALSRYREYAADHDAAAQLGQPALLAATLLKAGDRDAIPRTDLRAARVPAMGLVATKPTKFAWWSTHPPLTKRIDRLTKPAT
ncbi:zinc metalloprotease HtpX [Sphaerisporangium album]|uniref:Zinc metalloprotease HtpX n=1 Tax=Sphaerisporangium album TaxID=509200 RepID=A0A367FPA7_9ACTN|nr:M48 family metalloprotease [Sphaerisporangium album]RCG32228.1 zinc metalloprotease HtpX [Sphaerisporangium album]